MHRPRISPTRRNRCSNMSTSTPDAVLRPGGLRLPTVRRHRSAKGIRRTARTHRPRTLPAAYGVFLFGRQAADHDLFGHFDQRAEHERDRGEQYPGHRLVQGDALTRRAGSICPAAWPPEDSSRKTAAGRQQPGDSSRETAADGCSWHSGNRYGGNRHGRHHTLPPRGCRGFPGAPESPPYHRNAGTSRNHPDMPGLLLLKQKEAPSTGASF